MFRWYSFCYDTGIMPFRFGAVPALVASLVAMSACGGSGFILEPYRTKFLAYDNFHYRSERGAVVLAESGIGWRPARCLHERRQRCSSRGAE